jgi:probable addiction module antidote protein
MAKVKTTPFDAADYLKTPADIAAYLEATFEESGDDSAEIARALGTIARAKGMTKVARDAGLSRESLYKALSGDRSPDFATILKVVKALGLRLSAEAANR